jgi:isopentenyl phosphate kinase
MKKIILIKLGGSLITDKNKIDTARFDVIDNLVIQIKSALVKTTADKVSLIIATGAGGFGHPAAKKYENDLEKGMSEIKEAVKKINKIVVDSLTKAGMRAESVEPSKIAEYTNGKMTKLQYSHIVGLLEKNIIPVFHADLIFDKKRGVSILSMDQFLVDVAIYLKGLGLGVDKVVFCGTTDGVLDDNGKTIEKINQENYPTLAKYFFKNNQVDTSGGMRRKVTEALRLIDKRITCLITNGQNKNDLVKIILGEEVRGTCI